MKKLCLIFNLPSLYRKNIYHKIDESFDCDWYFTDLQSNIKTFDTAILKNPIVKLHVRYFGKSCFSVYGLSKLLVDNRYDTFLMIGDAHDLGTWKMLIRKQLFHRKKRIFFWTHGWYGKEITFEKILKKAFFKMVDGIFLYGNYARNLMIKEGFNPKKLFVIHNSLNYEQQISLRQTLKPEPIYQMHFGNDNPNLIFVGRLTNVKKLDMALKAISLCKEKGYDFNLTLIGDGEAKEELLSQAKYLGIEKQVWFNGACYDEEILGKMIYNADLCVSPGNVGLTAMHSLAYGTPVITHNDFGHQMPEFEAIHEGINGTFFKEGNVESLAESIVQWSEEKKEKRDEVRHACYEEIDTQWTPDFQINTIMSYIHE